MSRLYSFQLASARHEHMRCGVTLCAALVGRLRVDVFDPAAAVLRSAAMDCPLPARPHLRALTRSCN